MDITSMRQQALGEKAWQRPLRFATAAYILNRLKAFAGGLLGLYVRTPGMREPRNLRPAPDGIPPADDAWPAAIGVALIRKPAGPMVIVRSPYHAGTAAARRARPRPGEPRSSPVGGRGVGEQARTAPCWRTP